MFKYKTHSRTNETIGFIKLTDVDANENLRLDVQISVGALLKKVRYKHSRTIPVLEMKYFRFRIKRLILSYPNLSRLRTTT